MKSLALILTFAAVCGLAFCLSPALTGSVDAGCPNCPGGVCFLPACTPAIAVAPPACAPAVPVSPLPPACTPAAADTAQQVLPAQNAPATLLGAVVGRVHDRRAARIDRRQARRDARHQRRGF
jgi:hypothetical protein